MNNHVHQLGKNTETISHVEVMAIKEALVKALSQNGVGREEINRIRKDLGLAPDGTADRTLAQRSVKPLTYTLAKNDETGAVTIRYSEPEGFPFKFHWETTVALDGTPTTTPITVDA